MRLFHGLAPLPDDARGAVLALGNFDGVHHGHRSVIELVERIAAEHGTRHGIVTFEPHPREFFRPDLPPFRLTTAASKARLIEALGVDLMVVLTFDRALSQQSAEAFVRDILVGSLGAVHVVIGDDFHFGRGREGTPEMLDALGAHYGFGVTHTAEVVGPDGIGISSTRIRELLRAGEPADAARLLGHWWEIEGIVLSGFQRGRTIDFPTANTALGPLLEPKLGVYAVRALIDGRWHDGVANLGNRPTVDGSTVLLETHVFDYSGDLYGRELRVQLLSFIRPERKFENFAALTAQIAADAAEARVRLGSIGEKPPPLA